MAIRQSPEDYFHTSQQVHEQPQPITAEPYYPQHAMIFDTPSNNNMMMLFILGLVAIVGLIGLLALLGTKDRK